MWPLEYTELKLLEDLLVCGICYEYMNTSVITSCSHNYCSLCIRKYLHYKTQCPVCFSETFEKDLRKNKVLDDIILHFSHVKKKLQRCLQEQVQVAEDRKDNSTPSRSKCIDKNICNTPSTKSESKMINNSLSLENKSSPSVTKDIQNDLSSPSTSGNNKIALIFTPKSKRTGQNAEESKVVVCPVCKVSVSEMNINKHLDDCLKREAVKDRPPLMEQKRKPLPKLVLSLMKDSVIRKKLKELGLPSQGDRKALETRLQRYIVLYNAECDKTLPRPVSELIRQCEDEENLEKKVNKSISSVNKLQVNRNTEQNVIDDERKKYLEAHKHSFETLIAQIKNTKTAKKSPVRQNILDQSISPIIDVPCKRQAVLQDFNDTIDDTDSNDFQAINFNDRIIQDSDSDTSCPLQSYSSTDPMKSVRLELFSSDTDNTSQKKCTSDSQLCDGREEIKSYDHPPIKVEMDCNNTYVLPSDADVVCNKQQLMTEVACQQNVPKHDAQEICSTPKSKMSLQRRTKICHRDNIRKMEYAGVCVTELQPNGVFKQEEVEHETVMPVFQDRMYDLSSNDSTDYKDHYETRYAAEDKSVNDSVPVFSNLEKENISSSSECGENRVLRKRSHDSIQNHNKASITKKRLRTSSRQFVNENEMLNNDETVSGILSDNENCRSQKTTRVRKQGSNLSNTTDTTVLRKSSRTRFKNNSLLK